MLTPEEIQQAREATISLHAKRSAKKPRNIRYLDGPLKGLLAWVSEETYHNMRAIHGSSVETKHNGFITLYYIQSGTLGYWRFECYYSPGKNKSYPP